MKQGNLFRVYLLNCRLSLMGGVDAAVLLFIWSYATAFYKIRVGDKLQNGIWAFPNQTTPTGVLPGCSPFWLRGLSLPNLRAAADSLSPCTRDCGET